MAYTTTDCANCFITLCALLWKISGRRLALADTVKVGKRKSEGYGALLRFLVLLLCCVDPMSSISDIDLASLPPAAGVRMQGGILKVGLSVGIAGDVNGDGYGDIIIGAPDSSGTIYSAGAAYIMFGSSTVATRPVFDFSTTDPASTGTGFRIVGGAIGDNLGFAVSGAGDVNGDGYADVIAGALNADPLGRTDGGAAYVVFGHSEATPFLDIILPAWTTSTSTGYLIFGAAAGDQAGYFVGTAGDVNGDGLADVTVGAYNADPFGRSNAGTSYVIFGKRNTTAPTDLDLSTMVSGSTTGFRIFGAATGDQSGCSVRSAGDVNGDGIADVIVGNVYADAGSKAKAGMAYVIFGHRGAGALVDVDLLAMVSSQTTGFRVLGAAVWDQAGWSVSAGGDLNGDGIGDVLVGALNADPFGRVDAGTVYVLFGHRNTTPFADVDLSTMVTSPSIGYRILGAAGSGQVGYSVCAAGDVNGDGRADVVIGARMLSPNDHFMAGATYVLYGRKSSSPVVDIDLSTMVSSETAGFRIFGALAGDQAGYSVSGAGDFNGDGLGDVITGAPFAVNGGMAYVIFGETARPTSQPTTQPSSQPSSQPSRQPTTQPSGQPVNSPTQFPTSSYDIDLSTLSSAAGSRTVGAVADGESGFSISGAGDVNGDGLGDVIVGARLANVPGAWNGGAAYVLFGSRNKSTLANADLLSMVTSAATGFRILGAAAGDNCGYSVSGAGDVNGDGFSDVVVGAVDADPSGRSNAGAAYVVFGHSTTTPFVDVNLATMVSSATTGFRILGAASGDNAGWSVSGAGDVNNDGYADVMIGAVNNDPYGRVDAGTTYVLFGHGGASPFLDVDLLTIVTGPSTGLRVAGASAGDNAGWAVSTAGDVNGDGKLDMIIGAYHADPQGRGDAGAAYVLFGHSVPFADVDLLNMTTGATGYRINGAASVDNCGYSVSAAGDVNGDGFGDVVVSALLARPFGRTRAGTSYVVFGHSTATSFTDVDLLTMVSGGTTGFRIFGAYQSLYSGIAASTAGDINGDGIGDVIIGARYAGPFGKASAGITYVLFGHSTNAPFTDIDLLSMQSNPSTGFRIFGAVANDESGIAVSSAGDVNGDGVGDVIVGAHYANALGRGHTGVSYVLYGKPYPLPTNSYDQNINALGGAVGKIFGAAATDESGYSVSGAGDFNGDGLGDIIVGAHQADPSGRVNAGAAYVLFGRWGSATLSQDIMSMVSGPTTGFRILGAIAGDHCGIAVSSAGDFNGDGYDDVLVGAVEADPLGRVNAGVAYVLFGHGTTRAFSDIDLLTMTTGATVGIRVIGAAAGDNAGFSLSTAGDLNNDGNSDIIVGARYGYVTVRGNTGLVYVLFGYKNTTVYADVDLLSMTTGPSTGYRIVGAAADDNFGWSVSNAGDVNGDGAQDMVLGARYAAPIGRGQAGASYILYGHHNSVVNDIESATGFRIFGAKSADQLGICVSGAGDVNGDGFADVIVGAWRADVYARLDAGVAYVIFGHSTSTQIEDIDLLTMMTSAATGFRILGAAAADYNGVSVIGAGDVNGDGMDDIVMGASSSSPQGLINAGTVYVLFGRGYGQFLDIDLLKMVSGPTVGYRIFGSAQWDLLGFCVSSASDVNGDGFADVLVGAYSADPPGRNEAGVSYVIYGGAKSPTSQPSCQPTSQPSRQPSARPSAQPSRQPSNQPSRQPSVQPAGVPTTQPSRQPSAQPSLQPSTQPSGQPVGVPTAQPSSRPTSQSSSQPSRQPSVQPSSTPTRQPSSQPSMQPSRQPVLVPTAVPSAQPSGRPSSQPSRQPSRQPTSQPSSRPSMQPSAAPTLQPSRQPSVRPTSQPSSQPSRQPTAQPSAQPSSQPSVQPSTQPSSRPSSQPLSQPSSKPSLQPSTQPSGQPSSRPTLKPTNLPSGQPTAQPSSTPTRQPTSQPSMQPSMQPVSTPTAVPSAPPSSQPSGKPTSYLSSQPSHQPLSQPTQKPSLQPSTQPSGQPTGMPSGQPHARPSSQPSSQPSRCPTTLPSTQPSSQPSVRPTSLPVAQPSTKPTSQPSALPTLQPFACPSLAPSARPSSRPTGLPSVQPSTFPTGQPTSRPSAQPSVGPTSQPSRLPTAEPSSQPSARPTSQPGAAPTTRPSPQPTSRPTGLPSAQPSRQPSSQPSRWPTAQPTVRPTSQPLSCPTSQPSGQPSAQPSLQPWTCPSSQPSSRPSASFSGEHAIVLNNGSAIDNVVFVGDDVWACGQRRNSSTKVNCIIYDAMLGTSVTQYTFPWAGVRSVLTTQSTDRVLVSGQSTGGDTVTSEVANCVVLSGSMACVVSMFRGVNLRDASLNPFKGIVLQVGQYGTFPTVVMIDPSTNTASGYIYRTTAVAFVSLLYVQSVPRFVGSFVAGTCVSSGAAQLNYIVSGWVNAGTGVVSTAYISPATGTVRNSADLVTALVVEPTSADSFIAGGMEVNDGSGTHAYFVRTSALYQKVGYGVKYVQRAGPARRRLKAGVVRSVVRGMVLVDNNVYSILDSTRDQVDLTVLLLDGTTGTIIKQISISAPNANLLCTDISTSGVFLSIACSLQSAISKTQSLLLTVDQNLSFKRLPQGFVRYGNNTYYAASTAIRVTSMPMTASVLPVTAVAYAIGPTNDAPSYLPSRAPTKAPFSLAPTPIPSISPSSALPSSAPSAQPSSRPTATPTISARPTSQPSTAGPTTSREPTVAPSQRPSSTPRIPPTALPSKGPTEAPSTVSAAPSVASSGAPSTAPSSLTTAGPSRAATSGDTPLVRTPSMNPTMSVPQRRSPSTKPTATATPTIVLPPTPLPTVVPVSNANGSRQSATVPTVVVGVSVGGAVLLLVALAYVVYKRRSHTAHANKMKVNKIAPEAVSPPGVLPNLQDVGAHDHVSIEHSLTEETSTLDNAASDASNSVDKTINTSGLRVPEAGPPTALATAEPTPRENVSIENNVYKYSSFVYSSTDSLFREIMDELDRSDGVRPDIESNE